MGAAVLQAGSWRHAGLTGHDAAPAQAAPTPSGPPVASNELEDPSGVVGDLLRRMRTGDRSAAAEFMDRYGARIRRRVRWKLSRPMRRLFDSMDVLSTVTRRLDLYVGQGRMEASVPKELWSLVFRLADHAVVDRTRVTRRLRHVEGSDSAFAASMLRRLEEAESQRHSTVEVELEQVFRALPDKVDRQVLSLWLEGETHVSIAEHLGMSESAARQRWHRLRETLRRLIDDGALG